MTSKLSLDHRYIYEYLQALDCPKSLAVWLLYSNKEYEQLFEVEFNPLDFNDCQSSADALAASKFLSKYTGLNVPWDIKARALQKFFDAEQVCKETNQRIRLREFKTPHAESLISMTIWKIGLILGSFDADEFVDACNWGPGASTSIPRRRASQPNKYQFETDITPSCYDFCERWFSAAYPIWKPSFKLTPSNKIVTVPKTSKIDRTIAIEPGINLWFQKGIGSMIRRRLRRFGIDLTDQSHNQRLSKLASKFNALSTVDFSAASDTISYQLVQLLLPEPWLDIMDRLRSSHGAVDGTILKYEKYSSMGNGFTFELESLIFFCLADSVCSLLNLEKSGLSVYGDDVIIPSLAFDTFSSISRDLGFSVNKAKSYSSSYFRESCGSYYWNGVSIKPIFHKEPLNDTETTLKSANNVRRYAHSRNDFGCDRRFRRCWTLLSGAVRRTKSCGLISEGYGDIGLIVNFDEACPPRARRGFEGYLVTVTSVKPSRFPCDGVGLLLSRLKSFGTDLTYTVKSGLAYGNYMSLPARVQKSRIRLLIPRWYDLGPWI